MIFHRSKPTDFERLLERQRHEFPTHYVDRDAAVDQLLANKPEFRVNADGDGGGIPKIPMEVMGKLLDMDINKSYYTRASWEEKKAFGWPHGGMDDEDEEDFGKSTDVSAFYIPFHSFPRHWGVYIYLHGIHGIRRGFQQLFQAYNINDPEEQITIANDYLYFHELYHHKTESFGLRVEAILGLPFYFTSVRLRG